PLDPNDELAGDIGAACTGVVNVGTAISAAKARAAISIFMTRLHVGLFVLDLRGAEATRPAPASGNMYPPVPPCCDSHHIFRTLQRDSDLLCAHLGVMICRKIIDSAASRATSVPLDHPG